MHPVRRRQHLRAREAEDAVHRVQTRVYEAGEPPRDLPAREAEDEVHRVRRGQPLRPREAENAVHQVHTRGCGAGGAPRNLPAREENGAVHRVPRALHLLPPHRVRRQGALLHFGAMIPCYLPHAYRVAPSCMPTSPRPPPLPPILLRRAARCLCSIWDGGGVMSQMRTASYLPSSSETSLHLHPT